MSENSNPMCKCEEIFEIFKNGIAGWQALYQLITKNEEEINTIYQNIKTNLIDKLKIPSDYVIRSISDLVIYRNRYIKSFLKIAKNIYDDYHLTQVDVSYHFDSYSHQEIGFIFNQNNKNYIVSQDSSKSFRSDVHEGYTIFKAIMENDKESFIDFTERTDFDEYYTELFSSYYPDSWCSLIELSCYYGAVYCFKFLRTKFKSRITQKCLRYSFLKGNPEIMNECLKELKPDFECMKNAIISHNVDFVTFLMNEYNITIDLDTCSRYNNLMAFFIYLDQTNEINECFINSKFFCIPSLCEYFISHGANINVKDKAGQAAIHY